MWPLGPSTFAIYSELHPQTHAQRNGACTVAAPCTGSAPLSNTPQHTKHTTYTYMHACCNGRVQRQRGPCAFFCFLLICCREAAVYGVTVAPLWSSTAVSDCTHRTPPDGVLLTSSPTGRSSSTVCNCTQTITAHVQMDPSTARSLVREHKGSACVGWIHTSALCTHSGAEAAGKKGPPTTLDCMCASHSLAAGSCGCTRAQSSDVAAATTQTAEVHRGKTAAEMSSSRSGCIAALCRKILQPCAVAGKVGQLL
jgi:hypothetical protein